MKKLLILSLLIYGTANAQTVTATQLRKSVDSVRLIATNAIAAQAKAQAVTDAKQDSVVKSYARPLDTITGGQLKIVKGKVTVLQDAAIPVLQSQGAALQKQVGADSSSIVTLKLQTESYQQQLKDQKATIDKQALQLTTLQAIIDKLKLALQ